MRKIYAVLFLSLCLTVSLYSCQKQTKDSLQGQTETEQTPDTDNKDAEEKSISVSEIAADLNENAAFPDMYVMSDDEIERQFGFSSDLFSEVYASAADQYPGIERIFIGNLKDENDKKTVVDALNDYLETLKSEYIDYVPSEYEKAKNVSVYDKGSYVCLVIAEDSDKALKIVQNYIK